MEKFKNHKGGMASSFEHGWFKESISWGPWGTWRSSGCCRDQGRACKPSPYRFHRRREEGSHIWRSQCKRRSCQELHRATWLVLSGTEDCGSFELLKESPLRA